ncbi:hypothetical protein [Streptomyces sp. NBC_00358]|uniref:hypothetical protein n=1 Tax=Streptomyces sp. NBC_00358 TaxID=2975725 RepID=UPI002E25BED1
MLSALESQDVDPFTAVESLRAALDQAGIVLPSLAVDPGSPTPSLVDLGRARADVIMQLAQALQRAEPGA